MPDEVPPPTQVLTLVFLAWAVGTSVFAAWSRLWVRPDPRAPDGPVVTWIQPGHFKVVWLVVTGFALVAGFGYPPAFALAGLGLATFAGIYAPHRRPHTRGLDRELGLATAMAGVALSLAFSGARVFDLGTAALLGAVSNAMLLGHWHLNQPRLGHEPILRLVYGLWAAIAVFVAVTVPQVVDALAAEAGAKTLGAVTAGAFVLFAAILNAPVHHLVRTRSIMSATGILYLTVLVCFVAAFTGGLAALAG